MTTVRQHDTRYRPWPKRLNDHATKHEPTEVNAVGTAILSGRVVIVLADSDERRISHFVLSSGLAQHLAKMIDQSVQTAETLEPA